MIWLGWVGFYSISTIVGYLMQNPLYTYILNCTAIYISQTIQVRPATQAALCGRSKDKLNKRRSPMDSYAVLADQQKTYIYQVYADAESRLGDLIRAMIDRDG